MRATALVTVAALLAGCGGSSSRPQPAGPTGPTPVPLAIGDQPVVAQHLVQADIEAGAISIDQLIERGKELFLANFNTLDGGGRPETTGTGGPRGREAPPHNFNRISAPDSNSCAGCHNIPRAGGGGDNVANVFVLGQRLPFVNFDGDGGDGFEDHTLMEVANERNTLGMFGSGYVELLAREMSAQLQAIRDQAVAQAAATGMAASLPLTAKGVSFGSITSSPTGTLDTTAVEGVDADLVIKPFHQKGVVVSLREFSNNAYNHHHGMQSEERFGTGVDADNDGHVNELTVGDMTAATLFQALLPVPGRVRPADPTAAAEATRGEGIFATIGCADCHIPSLVLDSPVFTEPNPFNPPGNLTPADVGTPVAVDLTQAGPGPHLTAQPNGSVMVPLFSDLKRHDIGALLNNEMLVQGGVPTEQFLTRKLWGIANEPPFLHHGRATLISEAILAHGGEAQAQRDAYAALPAADQAAIVEFLKTLQVLPEDSPLNVTKVGSGIVGDEPTILNHIDQGDIDDGFLSVDDLFVRGRALFQASFNTLDGQGRPETTGTGGPRARREFPENFNRISAPDSNSCFGCHNSPESGGGGDNVANVFVLGQRLPFVNFDMGPGDDFMFHTLEQVANERNTLGMFGSGYIELLSREMSTELQAQRDQAITDAASSGAPVVVALSAKGVSFGTLTVQPGGAVDTTGVEGVDADLVIKPFHQKGVVVSLREFSNNAYNHHHGMQSAERFGDGLDPDNDGHVNEMTVGDITAATVYQAILQAPGRVLPADPDRMAAVDRGSARFDALGCNECHVRELRLEDPVFTEPNPFNPAGNLRPGDLPQPLAFDLTQVGPMPHLGKQADGSVMVPAFTDLKRHDMGPGLDNETLVQAGVPTSEWLTRKLWGTANEPPFLHHGRALTLEEAILAHGGDAQTHRDAFAALTEVQRDEVVEFLKTLQVLAAGTPTITVVR